jgi:hypothetical protein
MILPDVPVRFVLARSSAKGYWQMNLNYGVPGFSVADEAGSGFCLWGDQTRTAGKVVTHSIDFNISSIASSSGDN